MVGGDVQRTVVPQHLGDQLDGARLQQTPLVVPSFGPWIGEEHPDAGQRGGRDHVSQHDHGVASDDPDVGEVLPADHPEELCDPWPVDVDGDHVDVGLLGRHRGGRGARSAADLEDQGRVTSEPGLGIDPVVLADLSTHRRPQPLPVVLLSGRETAAARPEAGHPRVETRAFTAGRVDLGLVLRSRPLVRRRQHTALGLRVWASHPAIVPHYSPM